MVVTYLKRELNHNSNKRNSKSFPTVATSSVSNEKQQQQQQQQLTNAMGLKPCQDELLTMQSVHRSLIPTYLTVPGSNMGLVMNATTDANNALLPTSQSTFVPTGVTHFPLLTPNNNCIAGAYMVRPTPPHMGAAGRGGGEGVFYKLPPSMHNHPNRLQFIPPNQRRPLGPVDSNSIAGAPGESMQPKGKAVTMPTVEGCSTGLQPTPPERRARHYTLAELIAMNNTGCRDRENCDPQTNTYIAPNGQPQSGLWRPYV